MSTRTTSSPHRLRPRRWRPASISRAQHRVGHRGGARCDRAARGRIFPDQARGPAGQRTRAAPHNSGHYSFDACVTSQFEQQLRAVCGLPLGDDAAALAGADAQFARRCLGQRHAGLERPARAAGLAVASLRQERAARLAARWATIACLSETLDQAREIDAQAQKILRRVEARFTLFKA